MPSGRSCDRRASRRSPSCWPQRPSGGVPVEPRPVIRDARPQDVALLLGLIRELAEYERLAEQVQATEALLHTALFGERPAAEALIAELDGQAAGYALFFPTFSTFLA